ncbi:hypothetical protein [Candidatus Albibeggiatoa sp. nov. NOAA]|uniref:hypothetical protein n=1 Tax=Candidatus Albibeggiatoa sp. nov. NOAA TaxID=3162724 RepID=UPI0032F560DE|nr:hypothetical protein [Thiotrichaceae bacterium]
MQPIDTQTQGVKKRKVLANISGANPRLQTSIHILNEFCSDPRRFSYAKLSLLKLPAITLHVNMLKKALTLVVSSEEDYTLLLWHLTPGKRLHQLMSMFFKRIFIGFGVQGEPIEQCIILEQIVLGGYVQPADLRSFDSLGDRLRRTMNVALQGHIGVLRLQGTEDMRHLKRLWMRGRIEKLLNAHHIVPFDDDSGNLIKLWKPHSVEEGQGIVIVVD